MPTISGTFCLIESELSYNSRIVTRRNLLQHQQALNMAARIPPQPDFAVVSQSFHDAAIELAKCPDLVGFHENTEVIELLRGLTVGVTRIDERLGRVEERLGRVEERLGRVEEHLERVEESLANIKTDAQAR